MKFSSYNIREVSRMEVFMKSTGIIKYIDFLGRFKIPKELLLSCDIKPSTSIQIYREGKSIVLGHSNNTCIFCFSSKNIHIFHGKMVCKNCIAQIINNFKNY